MRVNILFRRYLVLTVATAIILLGQQGAQAETAREWFDKGMDLTDVGMYEEALEAYDRALELNPNDAIAWNNKGLTLASMERDEVAVECYDKAIENDPNYADAWFNKAMTLEDLGRSGEAEECFVKAEELDPMYMFF